MQIGYNSNTYFHHLVNLFMGSLFSLFNII